MFSVNCLKGKFGLQKLYGLNVIYYTCFLNFPVLHEATASGDPDLVKLILKHRDHQRLTKRTVGVPELLTKLKEVRIHLTLFWGTERRIWSCVTAVFLFFAYHRGSTSFRITLVIHIVTELILLISNQTEIYHILENLTLQLKSLGSKCSPLQQISGIKTPTPESCGIPG